MGHSSMARIQRVPQGRPAAMEGFKNAGSGNNWRLPRPTPCSVLNVSLLAKRKQQQ